MTIKISDELKANLPQTTWGRVLAATPVVMAVIATMLAGLASSEMTRAQYTRSLAAQQQSKAGDQWAFFQAKRLRSDTQRNTLDLLQATTELSPLDLTALQRSAAQLPLQLDLAATQIAEARQRLDGANHDPPRPVTTQREAIDRYLQDSARRKAEADEVKSSLLAALGTAEAAIAFSTIQRGEVPDLGGDPALDPRLQEAIDAVQSSRPESEIAPFIARIADGTLGQALSAAKERAEALDVSTKPVTQAVDRIEKLLARQTALLQEARTLLLQAGAAPQIAPSLYREFVAARLGYSAVRNDGEARLNQAVANLYELQVRRSNLAAKHQHDRSQYFFYGMLAAQMGVIISTFALAARKRNLLWSLAAAAGLVGISFGLYVYLTV